MKPTVADVNAWMDAQLARNPDLRARVAQRMAELRLEEELVALREARGLTQRQLARLIGVTQPAIARIESGRAGNVRLQTLVQHVTALGGSLAIQVTGPTGAKVVGLRRRTPRRARAMA